MAPTAMPRRSKMGAAHEASRSKNSPNTDAHPYSCTFSSSAISRRGSVIVNRVTRASVFWCSAQRRGSGDVRAEPCPSLLRVLAGVPRPPALGGCCRDRRRDARPARGPRGRCLGGRSRWCALPARPTSSAPVPAARYHPDSCSPCAGGQVRPGTSPTLDRARRSRRIAACGGCRRPSLSEVPTPPPARQYSPAGAPGEEPEDGCGSFDRLDRPGHNRLLPQRKREERLAASAFWTT
jgi:hypothetical protein